MLVAFFQEIIGGIQCPFVIIYSNIARIKPWKVPVDQHYGAMFLAELFNIFFHSGCRGYDKTIHLPVLEYSKQSRGPIFIILSRAKHHGITVLICLIFYKFG